MAAGVGEEGKKIHYILILMHEIGHYLIEKSVCFCE